MSSLTREEALQLVRSHVAKENNVKHMIAVGAVMHSLAGHLGQDSARWELTGILHDIDFEVCTGICDHTLRAKEMLNGKVDDGVMKSILAHNFENTGVAPDDEMSIGLIASDAVSGLVTACALVMPSKKLADVQPESLSKKFAKKDFAKGADRERMTYCLKLNVPLDEFLSIALEGMNKRQAELGL